MATVMSVGGDWIGFPVNHLSTMAAARLDLSGQQLVYAAAGHPPALLISPCLTLIVAEIR